MKRIIISSEFLTKQKDLYNENDISDMLLDIRSSEENKERFIKLIDSFASGEDASVLRVAANLDDFFAEDFYKYDSDVSERFIRTYERFRGWR